MRRAAATVDLRRGSDRPSSVVGVVGRADARGVPTAFSLEHDGRRIEVVNYSSLRKDRVRLLVDGDLVAEVKPNGADTVVAGDGVEVHVVMPWHGVSITRAELVSPDGPLRLAPAPGSAAARRERLERERPGLYAARHVAKGVAQALAAIVGIGFAIRLLPDISLPLDLPDLPMPDIDPPSLDLPGWLTAVLSSKAIWLPVILGVVIALREWRRRRPAGTHRDRGGDDAEGGPPQRPDQQSGQGPVP
jgi:hypothetical protein